MGDFTSNVATENWQEGFSTGNIDATFADNSSTQNHDDGFATGDIDGVFTRNTAGSNDGDGFNVGLPLLNTTFEVQRRPWFEDEGVRIKMSSRRFEKPAWYEPESTGMFSTWTTYPSSRHGRRTVSTRWWTE